MIKPTTLNNRTRMTQILEIAQMDADFIRKSVKISVACIGVICVPSFSQYNLFYNF